jgi:hypothetical protein
MNKHFEIKWERKRGGWKGYLGDRWLFDMDCYRQGYWPHAALYRVGNDGRLNHIYTGRGARAARSARDHAQSVMEGQHEQAL